MNAILRGIKATYNFFSGDAIILSTVLIAFALGFFLDKVVGVSSLVLTIVFIALIVLGLALTLSREALSHQRIH
ncbi:MAG TPA: hypothetical protein VKQ30_16610 [Ktedonobacterales bacterium]|nr:hypothetical protein [Ktedonobacterales bacterium]